MALALLGAVVVVTVQAIAGRRRGAVTGSVVTAGPVSSASETARAKR